jgi:hypothetical protein
MPKKTPGKLQPPSPAAEFNQLPLAKWCGPVSGVYYRLNSTNPAAGQPWPAVFFSRQDRSRFDPAAGPGTLCIGPSLAGAMLEIFDDHWGEVGSPNRAITQSELETWWVSLIALPETIVFRTEGLALSKIGTDLQLLSGDHATAREWAVRLAAHPAAIGGIAYGSRHDHSRQNLAVFQRPPLLSPVSDGALKPGVAWKRVAKHGKRMVYGPAILLGKHPDLMKAVTELEVGILP